MESKGEEKEESGVKDAGPPMATNNQGVIINLLNFAMKIVHEEMAGFFDEHCDAWDYGEAELKAIMAGGGETLQQHAVYKDYLEIVNGHLDKFAQSAGYTSAAEVFDAVSAAVDHDKQQREKMMREMNDMFAQMRSKLSLKKGGAEGDAKGGADDADAKEAPGAKGEDGGEGAKAEAKGGERTGASGGGGSPGLMMFSQPIGLEYLLDSVINLAEYETLRMMMIMKAREKRMYRQLAERGNKRRADAAARGNDLVDGCGRRVLLDQYDRLKERLREMTPHRKDLHEELDASMATGAFEDDAGSRDADPARYAHAVDFLSKVSSPNAREALSAATEKLKEDRGTHVAYLTALHDHIDAIHDTIEQCMLAARRDPVSGGAAPPADAKGTRNDAKG